MRLALFGGSFDPPHRAHLAVAQAAADHFALDRVLLAPTGLQPLKRAGPVASFRDRLAMVELLCEEDERLRPSDMEAPRPDGAPNYTVDTLEQMHGQVPGAELFAIVGADSLRDLAHWRGASQLFQLATWIAVSRPGAPLFEELSPELATLRATGRLQLLPVVHLPISSTDLRRRLAMGERCEDALPPRVAAYICSHGLYRPAPTGA